MMYCIKQDDIVAHDWGGGTTAELFIFPLNCVYKAFDFDFRISLASIEQDESEFTPLPGVHRQLMVLSGAIKLTHVSHHSKSLLPFESDRFLGDWQTNSEGKANVINLMTREDVKGEVEFNEVELAENKRLVPVNDFTCFYLVSGSLTCRTYNLEPGDFLVVNKNEGELNYTVGANSKVIRIKVDL